MSFVNVKILEANRLSSEEVKGGNNTNKALWTNKLGSGVHVAIGDQIQVQSSFIGERGAGSEVIAFTGKPIDDSASYTISYLSASKENTIHDYRFTTGCSVIEWQTVKNENTLNDNKAEMVISFYKNANGENYTQLPRKFAVTNLQLVNTARQNGIWYDQEGSLNSGSNTSFGAGAGLPNHQVCYFTRTDTEYYYCNADYYFFSNEVNQTGYLPGVQPTDYGYWKIRNDNHKYKIYVCDNQYFNGSGVGGLSDIATDAPAYYNTLEPSHRTWIPLTQKVEVNVTQGFNSPQNVANELTKELKKTGHQNKIDYPFNLDPNNFKPPTAISTYFNSQTYKVLDCYNYLDWKSANYIKWNSSLNHQAIPDQDMIDYINVTNTIGIKRPELWDNGISVAYGLKRQNGDNYRTGTPENDPATYYMGSPKIRHRLWDTDQYLQTDIPFTTNNLNLLKDLFKAQGYYEELFDTSLNPYGNKSEGNMPTTVLNSRFLHINQFEGSFNNKQTLGCDDISSSGTATTMDSWSANHISLPIFFGFDNNASETLSDGISSGAYGCMWKDVVSETENYIKFYVGAKNNNEFFPPTKYLLYNDGTGTGTEIMVDTRIGWDTHFTAYGTCCIALTDGWTESDVNEQYNLPYWRNGVNAIQNANSPQEINPHIRKIFIGANHPLITYDTDSSRFDISQLHTPEYIGNVVYAGTTNASFGGAAANPDANQKVYKINKRNNCTNWTNALQPYSSYDVPTASATESYRISLMNYNMTPYSIFDSQSGIIIEDFGVASKDWDNSMWGIMGFTYEQFNGEVTSDNTLTRRITENNIKNLPYAITNADVGAGDCINFRVNGWGIPMYNAQLPTSFLWNGSLQAATPSFDGCRYGMPIENHPPITEIQKSISLVATRLPRKMLKPYYCIRSDIIDETHYLGGADSGTDLPVVAVINKINGYGDFYFAETSDLVFTATRARVITSITTSIHYPDQTFADVNNDSAIIYKIIHQQPATANILQEIMADTKPSKK